MPLATNPTFTQLLQQARPGDQVAFDRLFEMVYDELRRMAAAFLGRERAGHTMSTTALVHEAYLKMVDQQQAGVESRAHFFAIAARAIRQILIDYARRHHAAKRGGGAQKLPIEDAAGLTVSASDDMLALNEALARLVELDERQGKIVELRFFAGMTIEETARLLGIAPATVKREWTTARAWLAREINGGKDDDS